MKKHISTKQKGFTLIETFGAITILVVVVLGPLSLLTANISDGALIKSQMTAGYLAQEAIELVINQRDYVKESTWPDGGVNYWLEGLEDCIGQDEVCNVLLGDVDDGQVSSVSCDEDTDNAPASDPCNLSLDKVKQVYVSYTSGGDYEATNFRREVRIEPFDAINESGDVASKKYFGANEGAKVTVTVWWKFKKPYFNKKYVLSTVIYALEVSTESTGLQL